MLSVGRRKVNSKFVCCQWEDRRKIVSCVLAVGRQKVNSLCAVNGKTELQRNRPLLFT